MDILKRNLAPVTDEAWELIEEEATTMFNTLLSARRVVNVEGPKGWDFAAVPAGRLDLAENGKVKYGMRRVKPLVELRTSFELNIWELDNITRGARDIDLDAMEEAAKALARFEDDVMFDGLKEAEISGMKQSSEYKPVAYPDNVEDLPQTVAHGINLLQGASVEGPYTLLLGSEKWQNLTTCSQGYPLKRRIEEIMEGEIVVSQNLKDGMLLPQDNDDLLLTLGNDIAIGYDSHSHETVKLFFTEAFTFQVLDPAVIVVFS
jgi:uncharacterized linocin/CFP29 family protein